MALGKSAKGELAKGRNGKWAKRWLSEVAMGQNGKGQIGNGRRGIGRIEKTPINLDRL